MNISASVPVNPAHQDYPRNQWYVGAFSHEVGRGLLARTFLDVPVVMYRSEEGLPVALYDKCAHRGLPLSQGKLIGNALRCGYHGIEYDVNGRCSRIPQQDLVPPSMRVQNFPTLERGQLVWIWMGDPTKADPALAPDEAYLVADKSCYKAVPFFMMEMAANYQYMHDNLLDTSHLTFLHAGLLDNDDIARSKFWTDRQGQRLRLGRDTPRVRMSEAVAGYFNAKADYEYDRSLVVDTFVPSANFGRNVLLDPARPQEPALELHVLNALTPKNKRATYVFHQQITSYPREITEQVLGDTKYIVDQDKIAIEAIQGRFDEFNDLSENSIKSDKAGIECRRVIASMVDEERGKRRVG